jgi:hypothetical protein
VSNRPFERLTSCRNRNTIQCSINSRYFSRSQGDHLILGAFFPLLLVVGFGFLVAGAILVREIRLLTGAHRAASSKELKPPQAEHSTVKTHSGYKPLAQGVPQEQQSAGEEDTNRVEILERESDNEWLAEIASKLDPASPEDIELLNTARTMLKHANYTMGHLSGQSDRLKYAQGQQQKELSKQFIERKLVELKSTK